MIVEAHYGIIVLPDQSRGLFFFLGDPSCANGNNDIFVIVSGLDSHPHFINVQVFPLEEDLLRNPASDDPKISARVAAREIITPSHFEICLLDQRWPYQLRIVPIDYE
jgi:hypothetical protein